MSDSNLSSRTVLVTGATSGIGYETARLLAERGATVLVHGRTAEEAQAATDKLTSAAGVPAEQLCPFGAGFSRLEEVERLAHRVVVATPSRWRRRTAFGCICRCWTAATSWECWH
ncbi:SDR family NAD(P)-dependent oxidoreductase [Streptomyces sp. NBC_00353]|uniref:SDR family NAD(P)-dependent oxidoreductase n=1 Tax=Streptomyces sp. NBC_00353 TaxID=2975722 RepID=UPI003FA6AF3A